MRLMLLQWEEKRGVLEMGQQECFLPWLWQPCQGMPHITVADVSVWESEVESRAIAVCVAADAKSPVRLFHSEECCNLLYCISTICIVKIRSPVVFPVLGFPRKSLCTTVYLVLCGRFVISISTHYLYFLIYSAIDFSTRTMWWYRKDYQC